MFSKGKAIILFIESIFSFIEKVVLLALNLSPVLHISSDNNFDSIKNTGDQRISIISIPLGDSFLYILTFDSEKGCNLFYRLHLSDVQVSRDINKITRDFISFDKVNSYRNNNTDLRLDFLNHKYSDCINSLNTLNNKVNSYVAISLVYAGFCGYLLTNTIDIKEDAYRYISYPLIFIILLNLTQSLFLLRVYLKVKGKEKSSFSTFKYNTSKSNLTSSIYFDWLSISDEITLSASLVKNIEKYFIRSMISSVILLVVIFLDRYGVFTMPKDLVQSSFYIVDSNGDFSSEEFLRLSKESKSQEFVFISAESNAGAKELISFTIKNLKLSEDSRIITLKDEVIDGYSLIVNTKD